MSQLNIFFDLLPQILIKVFTVHFLGGVHITFGLLLPDSLIIVCSNKPKILMHEYLCRPCLLSKNFDNLYIWDYFFLAVWIWKLHIPRNSKSACRKWPYFFPWFSNLQRLIVYPGFLPQYMGGFAGFKEHFLLTNKAPRLSEHFYWEVDKVESPKYKNLKLFKVHRIVIIKLTKLTWPTSWRIRAKLICNMFQKCRSTQILC